MTEAGTLYVVATPIGNLGDFSVRARDILASVALIAAEDTRHSGRLLQAFGIRTPMLSLHEHNEVQRAPDLVDRMRGGNDIALISDAGTPLISDPGFRLVQAAASAGLRVSPVPGPSSILAALSVSAQPSDRFVFEGFLPSRNGPRRKRLAQLRGDSRTLVLLEAGHRISDTLADLAAVFGEDRRATVARELTKLHETILRGRLEDLARRVREDGDQRRGEFTLVVAGAPAAHDEPEALDVRRLLSALLDELPPGRAAAVAARTSGQARRELYRLALELADAR